MKQIAWLVGGFLAWTCTVNAQTVIIHRGTNDPVTEGFTQFGTLAGYPTNSGGTAAWSILDTTAANRLRYDYTLTSGQQALLRTNGWQLTWELEIVSGTDTILTDPGISANGRAIEMNFSLNHQINGGRRYTFFFGRSNDAATVRIEQGTGADWLLSVPGAANGFHTWSLDRRPGTDVAQFYVDGVFLTNYAGWNNENQMYWGSVAESSTGHAHWGLVVLEVPEPSALGLLMAGALAVSFLRRR